MRYFKLGNSYMCTVGEVDGYSEITEAEFLSYTEVTPDKIKARNQKELLKSLSSDTINPDDLIRIILCQYKITDTEGNIKPVADVIGTEIELPIKLGSKWEKVLDSDSKTFSYRLVSDPNTIGTGEDNPIIYTDEVPLINNAFYKKDGKICVYMNGEFIDW